MITEDPAVTSRLRRRAATATGIGNFMEWFDFAVYGFFATTFGELFFPSEDPAVSLLSSLAVFGVAFFMRPVGGFVIGSVGDRKGRRAALMLTVVLMGASTALIGVLPTYEQTGLLAPALLLVLRCCQGFSAGGEWTGSSAFLLEHAPRGRRGYFGSVISATAAIATVAGSLVALALNSWLSPEALNTWGWRLPFLAAAPLALIGLYIRLRLPETPVFVDLRQQQRVEGKPLITGTRKNAKSIALCFFFASVQGLGFYYLATFVVNYLSESVGMPRTTSLALSGAGLLIYALLCPLAGILSDRFGRRPVNVIGSAGHALLCFPAFMLMSSGSGPLVLLGIVVFSVSQALVSVTTVVLLTELFPAATRGSGSAIGFNLGLAVIGGPGPFVAAAIAGASGYLPMPAIYMTAVAAAGFFVVLLWLPETAGRDLRADDDVPLGRRERAGAAL
ncbi:MFS transporter [Streptomyces bathyalis]|uniref:MFS transporter n=1 Tax=Streptomyces bathyalis TaxID=2710756 RepID=UPI0018D03FE7|nr:MFS transporter [Streptomyces bathyalis]